MGIYAQYLQIKMIRILMKVLYFPSQMLTG